MMNGDISSLIRDIIFETLRIALLAAAFDLCISVGAERKAESDAKKAEQKAEAAQPVEA
jgi:hypothetical protein